MATSKTLQLLISVKDRQFTKAKTLCFAANEEINTLVKRSEIFTDRQRNILEETQKIVNKINENRDNSAKIAAFSTSINFSKNIGWLYTKDTKLVGTDEAENKEEEKEEEIVENDDTDRADEAENDEEKEKEIVEDDDSKHGITVKKKEEKEEVEDKKITEMKKCVYELETLLPDGTKLVGTDEAENKEEEKEEEIVENDDTDRADEAENDEEKEKEKEIVEDDDRKDSVSKTFTEEKDSKHGITVKKKEEKEEAEDKKITEMKKCVYELETLLPDFTYSQWVDWEADKL